METQRKTNRTRVSIPRDVEILIFTEARRKPDEPRKITAATLRQLIRDMGYAAPSRLTLEKMISRARNVSDPEDVPWGVLNTKDDIPPEILPTVLEVWMNVLSEEHQPPLTVRQAKWVARLCRLAPISGTSIRELLRYARIYAGHEQAMELLPEKTSARTALIRQSSRYRSDLGLYDHLYCYFNGKPRPDLRKLTSPETLARLGLEGSPW